MTLLLTHWGLGESDLLRFILGPVGRAVLKPTLLFFTRALDLRASLSPTSRDLAPLALPRYAAVDQRDRVVKGV